MLVAVRSAGHIWAMRRAQESAASAGPQPPPTAPAVPEPQPPPVTVTLGDGEPTKKVQGAFHVRRSACGKHLLRIVAPEHWSLIREGWHAEHVRALLGGPDRIKPGKAGKAQPTAVWHYGRWGAAHGAVKFVAGEVVGFVPPKCGVRLVYHGPAA